MFLTTLPSGLRVITARLPGFDSAAVAAFINAGCRNEKSEENGIAHFLEHMAFKGTITRTSLEISAEVEKLGSNINAYTSYDRTAYYVTGLVKNIEKSVAIIGDVLLNSVFNECDIETEKGVILQEISRSNDDPTHVAYDNYSRTAFPNQSLGRPILGPPAFIKSATKENFTSFVNRWYVAENMIVVGVGDIEHDDFVRMVEKHFSNIKTGIVPVIEKARWIGGESHDVSQKFEQVTALIGWQSVSYGDERNYAHGLLSQAIGGGMSSPLFQEVREKRGLVYAVGTQQDSSVDHGDFTLYAGTTPDKIEEVIKVAFDVLYNAENFIKEDDLERARNKVLVNCATIKEKPFPLASFLADKVFATGVIVTPDEMKAKYEAVEKSDLIKSANEIFNTKSAVALVGPVSDKNYINFDIDLGG